MYTFGAVFNFTQGIIPPLYPTNVLRGNLLKCILCFFSVILKHEHAVLVKRVPMFRFVVDVKRKFVAAFVGIVRKTQRARHAVVVCVHRPA